MTIHVVGGYMTVGLNYDNRRTAVVIADTEVSGYGRKSDSFTKLEQIANEKYHAVIFGTGLGNDLARILNKKEALKAKKFEDFIKNIQGELKNEMQRKMQNYMDVNKKNIETAASAIADKKRKEQFVDNETGKMLRNYEEYQRETGQSLISVVGYDKEEGRIRKFHITYVDYSEGFVPADQIGSGKDGAHMYFSKKTQGIDPVELETADILFHAASAYSWSTTNIGVGGTPRVAIIDEEGVQIKEGEEVAALTTATNAYQAELLTKEEINKIVKQMLSKRGISYRQLSRKLGFSEENLRAAMIPYETLQEIANKRKAKKK